MKKGKWSDMTMEQRRAICAAHAEKRHQETLKMMREELKDLQAFTADCREDMHEPDGQGISAVVVGNHLDNAFGASVIQEHIKSGYQEFVVVLKKEGSRKSLNVNLSSLIALARKAQV